MATTRGADKWNDRLLAALDDAVGEKGFSQLLGLIARGGPDGSLSALLRHLTHLHVSEDEAKVLLRSALRHRESLRARLGRDVGARTALFDLLVGIERRLSNPKIIELAAFERIERSAVTDHMTGLYNRSYFDSRLQSEIRRARRYGQNLSLVMIDVDDFKSINDTRGHLVGDQVLREIGGLFVEHVRDIDIPARYGGEEFAVILPETRRAGAFVVAERIRNQIERHFRRRGGLDRAVRTTISGGLACYPEDAEDPGALVAKSDQALYRAKESGKNVIAIFFEEKRRAERYPIDDRRWTAVLQGEAGTGRLRRSARLLNISEGGALVEITEPVPVGSELRVTLTLGVDRPLTLPSTVVRLEESGENGKRRRFEAGLRFQKRARRLQPQLHRLVQRQAAAG